MFLVTESRCYSKYFMHTARASQPHVKDEESEVQREEVQGSLRTSVGQSQDSNAAPRTHTVKHCCVH